MTFFLYSLVALPLWCAQFAPVLFPAPLPGRWRRA